MKIPGPDHPIAIEANQSRGMVTFGGKVIADAREALTLREATYLPVQYIPRRNVDMAALTRSEHTTSCPIRAMLSTAAFRLAGITLSMASGRMRTPFEAMAQIKE